MSTLAPELPPIPPNPFGSDDFDWAEEVEDMYDERRHSQDEENQPCNLSVGSTYINPDTNDSPTSPCTLEFDDVLVWSSYEDSLLIAAPDLAKSEAAGEAAVTPPSAWPSGWLETREINQNKTEIYMNGGDTIPEDAEIGDSKQEVAHDSAGPKLIWCHHLNFHNEPVYHKVATPPEVSLFVIVVAGARSRAQSLTREYVIDSQAGKFIDPVNFNGPQTILQLHGTTLRDALTGYVDKIYQPVGTWGWDLYSSDETVPICTTGLDTWYEGTNYCGPPVVYRMQACDTEVKINDDGRAHAPQRNRAKDLPGRSKLCIIQIAYDDDETESEADSEYERGEMMREVEQILSTGTIFQIAGVDRMLTSFKTDDSDDTEVEEPSMNSIEDRHLRGAIADSETRFGFSTPTDYDDEYDEEDWYCLLHSFCGLQCHQSTTYRRQSITRGYHLSDGLLFDHHFPFEQALLSGWNERSATDIELTQDSIMIRVLFSSGSALHSSLESRVTLVETNSTDLIGRRDTEQDDTTPYSTEKSEEDEYRQAPMASIARPMTLYRAFVEDHSYRQSLEYRGYDVRPSMASWEAAASLLTSRKPSHNTFHKRVSHTGFEDYHLPEDLSQLPPTPCFYDSLFGNAITTIGCKAMQVVKKWPWRRHIQ